MDTKRSRCNKGGEEEEDCILLGQHTMTTETQGQETTSSVASSDSNIQIIEFPSFLDFTTGEPIKSTSRPYRCGGCENHKNLCPEVMFGVFLCQKMISLYERH